MGRVLAIFGSDDQLVTMIPLTEEQYSKLDAAMQPGQGELSNGEGIQPDPDRLLCYNLADDGLTVFLETFAD